MRKSRLLKSHGLQASRPLIAVSRRTSMNSEARRAHDEQHFRGLISGVDNSMWHRTSVVDAVAHFELIHVSPQLQMNLAGQDEQQLLRVAVRVGLIARRSAHIERTHEHFEPLERTWRQ